MGAFALTDWIMHPRGVGFKPGNDYICTDLIYDWLVQIFGHPGNKLHA